MPKMYHEIIQININGKLKDINPIYFKYVRFVEGMGYPQRIRNLSVITYVKEGHGTFEIYGKQYSLHGGQVYIIPQGVVTSVRADDKDPWKCISVGFEGECCHDFEKLPPVFDSSPELFEELLAIADFEGRKDIAVASVIMRMYSAWMPHDAPQSENSLASIKLYIDNNFMNPISVEEIAKEHNMDRTYLSKLFKKKYGKSLKEYIIYTRLKEARLLLTNGKNVTEAALFCGFNSPAHFSRIYKKYYMDPPVAHKESNYVDRIERK